MIVILPYERILYMKISTQIHVASEIYGEHKAVEMVANAGFDAWDFSMFSMCNYDRESGTLSENDHPLAGKNYLAFARELKHIGLENGIVCNQSHAPFPSTPIIDYLKRAIECTAEAGGKICVIHPDNKRTTEENKEFYLKLLPFAKEYGVKIATENTFVWNHDLDHVTSGVCMTPQGFNALLDAVNDDFFVACLDIGHAEMYGTGTSAAELTLALGNRLQALHIHDNDCRHDSHQIPFSMDIDFAPAVYALKDIGYDGYFTLECDNYLQNCPEESLPDRLKTMASVAKKLADMFEAK